MWSGCLPISFVIQEKFLNLSMTVLLLTIVSKVILVTAGSSVPSPFWLPGMNSLEEVAKEWSTIPT